MGSQDMPTDIIPTEENKRHRIDEVDGTDGRNSALYIYRFRPYT